MSKAPQYTLVWSDDSQHCELQAQDHPVQLFCPGDESTFADWPEAYTSLAFVGRTGPPSLLKEARSRGSGYWYVYYSPAAWNSFHRWEVLMLVQVAEYRRLSNRLLKAVSRWQPIVPNARIGWDLMAQMQNK